MPPTVVPAANVLDNAIARIQDIALACTSLTIRSAPDYPIENADPFPMVVTHLVGGSGYAMNASTLQFMPVVSVDFLFQRTNLKLAYQQSDAIALEFMQRLAGDPTLNGILDTIQISRDTPVSFEVGPIQWDAVTAHMLSFRVTFKTLEVPQTTA